MKERKNNKLIISFLGIGVLLILGVLSKELTIWYFVSSVEEEAKDKIPNITADRLTYEGVKNVAYKRFINSHDGKKLVIKRLGLLAHYVYHDCFKNQWDTWQAENSTEFVNGEWRGMITLITKGKSYHAKIYDDEIISFKSTRDLNEVFDRYRLNTSNPLNAQKCLVASGMYLSDCKGIELFQSSQNSDYFFVYDLNKTKMNAWYDELGWPKREGFLHFRMNKNYAMKPGLPILNPKNSSQWKVVWGKDDLK